MFIICVLFKIKLYKNCIYCLFIAFLKGLWICIYSRCLSIIILVVHWCCCSELIVHTNAGITVKCLPSDVWYFTFLQSLFFLRWNYMCFGIEPLFDLSIFTASVDKVKDGIYCITRCEKIIEHTETPVNIIYYIVALLRYESLWVHFKRNYNLFDQVLINIITFVLFSLYLNRS